MARKQASKKASTRAPEQGGISTRTFVAVIAVGLVLSVAAVLFGRADAGVINVAKVVNQSNTEAAESEGSDSRAANKPVVNARPDRPNGGLVGTGDKPDPDAPPEPEPEVEGSATSTASTSTPETRESTTTQEIETASTDSDDEDAEAATTPAE